MKQHRFDLNAQRYVVREHGWGTPVLLLHGFTGSGADWEAVMRDLGDRYRLIAPDLPGHGQSGAPAEPDRYGMARATADLLQLLDRLDVASAHLVGYSMGGRLALYLAVHAPARWRSVVVESASPGLADSAARQARRRRDEALADDIEREGIESFVRRWEQLPLWETQTPSQKARLREGRLRNRPVGLANSLRGMGTGGQPSLWERLEEVSLPILLLVGEHDTKFVATGREMARRLPASALRVVPDSGHAIHVEYPSRFSHLLREWLDSVP